jgi:tetratricopeptide (TPR) repeat protein
LLLADVELSEGNPKAALEQARQVLALEPKNAEAHHVMGLSLDALGETAAAIAQYEQATRLDTRNEQYAACYHAAVDASIPPSATPPNETRTGNARPGEVRPSPTRLSTIPRDDIRPEDVASANSANSPVYAECSDKPDRAGATAGAGRVVAASAEQPTHSGSDESADAQLAVRRAAEALRNNRPQQAIDIAIAALRRDPKSAALYRIKGAAHYRLGNYAAAQVAITQALSLDNTDALAYFLMGSTLQRLGQAEAAKRQFAEAARLDPRFAQTRD